MNYISRIEKLEIAIGNGAPLYVWRDTGESTRQAAERYVKESKGARTVDEVLAEGIFFSWSEAA